LENFAIGVTCATIYSFGARGVKRFLGVCNGLKNRSRHWRNFKFCPPPVENTICPAPATSFIWPSAKISFPSDKGPPDPQARIAGSARR